MTNLCPDCGANLAMVGMTHRCVARVVAVPRSEMTVEQHPAARAFVDKAREVVARERPVEVPAGLPSYKYRDPEARRAYMRDYMRKRRAGNGLRQG